MIPGLEPDEAFWGGELYTSPRLLNCRARQNSSAHGVLPCGNWPVINPALGPAAPRRRSARLGAGEGRLPLLQRDNGALVRAPVSPRSLAPPLLRDSSAVPECPPVSFRPLPYSLFISDDDAPSSPPRRRGSGSGAGGELYSRGIRPRLQKILEGEPGVVFSEPDPATCDRDCYRKELR